MGELGLVGGARLIWRATFSGGSLSYGWKGHWDEVRQDGSYTGASTELHLHYCTPFGIYFASFLHHFCFAMLSPIFLMFRTSSIRIKAIIKLSYLTFCFTL